MNKTRQLDLYYQMRRIRLIEAEIANNYYNEIREMHTPIHLCDGEEAIAVGVCKNLKMRDMIFSNHRSHGHYLAKGGSLDALIAELHGKVTGCCKGKGGSMHLCDLNRGIMLTSAIVAGNVPIAAGYALSQKMKGDGISVVFFGDGASEEGSVYESICFASLRKLPILFVCENNGVAISTPFELREPCEDVSSKFATLIPFCLADGNNVFEVYEKSKALLERIRRGEGPFLLECRTHRLRAHSNIGDGVDGKYRTLEEMEAARKEDPLIQSEELLRELGAIYSDEQIKAKDAEIKQEVEEAFARARKAAFPSKENLFDDIYFSVEK